MDNLEILEKIEKIKNLSQAVSNYLENKIYLFEFPQRDDLEIRTILDSCYDLMFDELKGLGLKINFLELDNYVVLDKYLSLYYFLTETFLENYLATNIESKLRLESLLQNTETKEEDLIQSYIEFCTNEFYPSMSDEMDKAIRNIQDIKDTLESTSIFKTKMLEFLDNIYTRSLITPENLEMVKRFIHKVKIGYELYKKNVAFILSKFPNLSVSYLQNSIKFYDTEKVNGYELLKYSWAILNENEKSTKDIEIIKQDLIYKHKANQHHHIEYYLLNRTTITKENVVELVCHNVEEDSTKEDFIKAINDIDRILIDKFENVGLISEENLTFMKECRDIILQNYDELVKV